MRAHTKMMKIRPLPTFSEKEQNANSEEMMRMIMAKNYKLIVSCEWYLIQLCLVIIYMFSTTKLLAVTAIIGKTGHHTEDEDIVDNEHARKGQSRLSDSTYCSFHLLLVGEHLQSRFISFIGGGGCAIRTIHSSIDPPALSWLMIQSRYRMIQNNTIAINRERGQDTITRDGSKNGSIFPTLLLLTAAHVNLTMDNRTTISVIVRIYWIMNHVSSLWVANLFDKGERFSHPPSIKDKQRRGGRDDDNDCGWH